MSTLAFTERCRLDAVSEADEYLLVTLHADPDVRRYLGGATRAESARRQLSQSTQNPSRLAFIVVLRETDEKVGIIDFGPHHDGENVEISYMMLPRFWGMGLAVEAIAKALDYKFATDADLVRIVAETQTANIASRRLLERLGFSEMRRLQRFGAEQTLYVKGRE